MPTEENRYYLADRAVELLNRKAIKRFEAAQSEAALLKFDELTVIKTVKTLYKRLASDNRKMFLDLAKAVYDETDPHGDDEPDETWLLAFLEEYNPVTRYVYQHEIDRKRDYTAEGVNSSKDKAKEFRRGLMYWSRMTEQYCLDVSDAATLKAFKDAGVKRVMWNTQGDDSVCDECKARDGKIYPIDKVPPKVHFGDRCYFTAVTD